MKLPGNGTLKVLGTIVAIIAGTVASLGWLDSRWTAHAAPISTQVTDHENRIRELERMREDVSMIRRLLERDR